MWRPSRVARPLSIPKIRDFCDSNQGHLIEDFCDRVVRPLSIPEIRDFRDSNRGRSHSLRGKVLQCKREFHSWGLLLKGQKGGGAVWAKSGHLALYYYHMLLARLGMGEGERASTSAGSRAYNPPSKIC